MRGSRGGLGRGGRGGGPEPPQICKEKIKIHE